MKKAIALLLLACLTGAASTQTFPRQRARTGRAHVSRRGLAPTPPMGWNSWDCYGPSVTEAEVKANAEYMAKHLKPFGWQYVVVDIQWYEPKAKAHGYRPNAELIMDEYGRLTPALNRFPSAAGGKGFKPLADYVHSLGLKFGIHIMRGIPRQAVRANTLVFGTKLRAGDVADTESTCPWIDDMYGVRAGTPGGQAYYDSISKLYAGWGVDYIKADDMSAYKHEEDAGADEARLKEIAALGGALKNSGRPMVLSLSPGPAAPKQVEQLRDSAHLWRISGDFWDRWVDLRRQFELGRKWTPYIAPNAWADADMLPLGRIAIRGERGDDRMSLLTKDEQVTLMSLWAIFRSPLMMGGDLPSNDAFTLSLLTNREVLAVNQHSAGNRELFARGDRVVWAADVPGSPDKYLAIFNLGDAATPVEIKVRWSELGPREKYRVRDLWQRRDLGVFPDEVNATVSRHGARLFRISPAARRGRAAVSKGNV
ncbi:MAG: glycoside hydrolase family 27 protein [Acidobacteriota bacterium]|nr:glycoside hydrolase family 27 protein [Acidobacteriota bacterium]